MDAGCSRQLCTHLLWEIPGCTGVSSSECLFCGTQVMWVPSRHFGDHPSNFHCTKATVSNRELIPPSFPHSTPREHVSMSEDLLVVVTGAVVVLLLVYSG